jgi:6-phosphogluconolactonase
MFQNLARTLILLVIILALAGGNVQAAGGGYLYALRNVNAAQNQIFGFQVNEVTGALTALPGFPVDTGGNGSPSTASEQLVYDPANVRLFALNEGSNTVSAYSVNLTTGVLTALPYSPFNLGSGTWKCLAVHPGGSPLVAGDSGGNFMASFNLTAGSATQAAGSPFTTGTGAPSSCAFSRDGQYVYTGGNVGASFAGFSVNAGTGTLTALTGSPFNSGALDPTAYVTDSAGRLFLANLALNQVRVFTTSAGLPSPVLTNPFASGLTQAIHGVLHPAGYYLVADRIGNRVGVYRIDGSGPSTTLTAVVGSPFAAGGTLTDVLALNQSGAYLFAANGTSRNITTFKVNAGTGALTLPVTQAVNTLGAIGIINGLAYVGQPQPPSPPGGGFVYTLEDRFAAENQIHGFSVNELTGALTPLSGFPMGTGGNGNPGGSFQQMTFDQANGRLYVINNGSSSVSAYHVDPSTGSLTALPFSPIALGAGNWFCLTVGPAGSTLVAGDAAAGKFASFNITAGSASAAAGSPYVLGLLPVSCVFSRDGAYVYGGSGSATTIAGFSVNPGTSVLTALTGSPFDSGGTLPVALATDDAGRLFVAHFNLDQLRVFATSDGLLSPVTGNPFAKGMLAPTNTIYGLLHPDGYYLVADRAGNRVGVYHIEGSGDATTLTAIAGSPFTAGGTYTNTLALNRSGTLLFAANGISRNITSYGFDASTGALKGERIQPWGTAGSTGIITGMAYVPGLSYLFLPLLQR